MKIGPWEMDETELLIILLALIGGIGFFMEYFGK